MKFSWLMPNCRILKLNTKIATTNIPCNSNNGIIRKTCMDMADNSDALWLETKQNEQTEREHQNNTRQIFFHFLSINVHTWAAWQFYFNIRFMTKLEIDKWSFTHEHVDNQTQYLMLLWFTINTTFFKSYYSRPWMTLTIV